MRRLRHVKSTRDLVKATSGSGSYSVNLYKTERRGGAKLKGERVGVGEQGAGR